MIYKSWCACCVQSLPLPPSCNRPDSASRTLSNSLMHFTICSMNCWHWTTCTFRGSFCTCQSCFQNIDFRACCQNEESCFQLLHHDPCCLNVTSGTGARLELTLTRFVRASTQLRCLPWWAPSSGSNADAGLENPRS